MNTHRISFTVDGLNLCGILHCPECSPRALIVGVHGLLADKNSPKQIALAECVSLKKMAYFRFDHRGCGESEGTFNTQTTLENRSIDLIAAIKAAQDNVGNKIPVGLFGSSLGGTICLNVANQTSPFALVTLAAPVQSRSIRLPEASPDSLKDEIVANRLSFNIKGNIQHISSVLIIHGSADETVPPDNADTIYRLASHPKRKIILENGDHRISNPVHQKYFIENTTKWFLDCYQRQFG